MVYWIIVSVKVFGRNLRDSKSTISKNFKYWMFWIFYSTLYICTFFTVNFSARIFIGSKHKMDGNMVNTKTWKNLFQFFSNNFNSNSSLSSFSNWWKNPILVVFWGHKPKPCSNYLCKSLSCLIFFLLKVSLCRGKNRGEFSLGPLLATAYRNSQRISVSFMCSPILSSPPEGEASAYDIIIGDDLNEYSSVSKMAFSAPAVPAEEAAPLHDLLVLWFLTAGMVRWESCVTHLSTTDWEEPQDLCTGANLWVELCLTIQGEPPMKIVGMGRGSVSTPCLAYLF